MVRNRAAAASTVAWSGAAAALLVGFLFPVFSLAQAVTMTGALELSQTYRPNAWQPVRLELRNPSDGAVDGWRAGIIST